MAEKIRTSSLLLFASLLSLLAGPLHFESGQSSSPMGLYPFGSLVEGEGLNLCGDQFVPTYGFLSHLLLVFLGRRSVHHLMRSTFYAESAPYPEGTVGQLVFFPFFFDEAFSFGPF